MNRFFYCFLVGLMMVGQAVSAATHSYPANCLAETLPQAAPTPVNSVTVRLINAPVFSASATLESAQIHIWRVACSPERSAVLIRVQREPANEGRRSPMIRVPEVFRAAQGDVTFGDMEGRDVVRISAVPNSSVGSGSGTVIANSTTYVLESEHVDLNSAFALRIDNTLYAQYDNDVYRREVAAYDPVPGRDPDAFASLKLSGRLTSAYYDPNRAGEGVYLEIWRIPGSGRNVLSWAWFTYDANGKPIWLAGNEDFIDGARQVTSPAIYRATGGFAGSAPSSDSVYWGDVTFEFPQCGRLELSYVSRPGQAAGIPTGSGAISMVSLGDVAGFGCD